jgi:hypothetical protein
MLHENLPLNHADRIIALVPPAIVPPPPRAFLSGLLSTKITSVPVPGSGKRPEVIFLATGILPQHLNSASFYDFCSALIASLGWNVHDIFPPSRVFTARKRGAKAEMVAFAGVISKDDIYKAVDSLARWRKRCILTNFTPSAKIVNFYGASDTVILHYTRAQEFMSLLE